MKNYTNLFGGFCSLNISIKSFQFYLLFAMLFYPVGLIYSQTVTNLTTLASYTTIQAAADAASTGDVIQIEPGVYNEQVTISTAITLQGNPIDPRSSIIVDGLALPQSRGGIIVNNNLTNVTIQHLTVRNFKKGTISGHTAGVYFKNGNNNATIKDVWCHDNQDMYGIYLNGGINNVNISNCKVEFSGTISGSRGIVIWNGFKTNIKIENDTVKGFPQGIELQDGSASGVLIKDNVVLEDGSIVTTGLTSGAGANIIEDNLILTSAPFGIEIRNPDGAGVDNPSVDGAIIIDGNIIKRQGTSYGISDIAGISVYRRYVYGTNVNVPNGVVIKNNSVDNFVQNSPFSHSTGFGILIEGTNHIVKNNNVINNNDVGIQVQAGYDPSSYPGDGDDNDQVPADRYFGRGNTQYSCNNLIIDNQTDTVRYVGVVTPTDAVLVNGVPLNNFDSVSICASAPIVFKASGEPTDSVSISFGGYILVSNSIANLYYSLPTNLQGTYQVKYWTPYSCAKQDSFKIKLTNQFYDTVNVSMCPGLVYGLPGGEMVDQAGIYYDTLQSQGGCDSIVVTNLSLVNASKPILNDDYITLFMNENNNSIAEQNNDSIPPASTLIILNGPKNGQATLQSDGTIVYTPNPNYYGLDSIIYQVCSDSCANLCSIATIHIDIQKFKIPQILSPNGDGVNDIFVIEGLAQFPNNKLFILDRWGDVLYKAAPF